MVSVVGMNDNRYVRTDHTYLHTYDRTCGHCGAAFTTGIRNAQYCQELCRTRASRARRDETKAGEWLRTPRTCPLCRAEFMCTMETGPNKKYCSPKCSIEARARYHSWWTRTEFPKAMKAYNAARARNHGPDTLTNRLRKRYPDLPTVCEVPTCTEARVLECAHKPEYRRNGGWRTMDKYERHMFWMLCPTCHRVLDMGIETPEQMGLVDVIHADSSKASCSV